MALYRVSDQAREDMVEIWAYIATDSVRAADRTNAAFYERFEALAEQPLMGRSRSELLSDLRSFPAGNYAIFYRPTENGVEILRVIHQARDITTMF